ncbi:MAG: NAD-dependent epimerase/dehydratase family protein [Candidatus Altiarchaeota archaeon]|nr:NAD-dependent epimerase/dehydratase family protein [Candidatus Altiarchaeota archaeon]
MSKVAVTGGAGFIGSHVVDVLLNRGYEVLVIDDLSNGIKENVNQEASFYEVNICDPFLREVLGKEGPDALIHLAAQSSLRNSTKNPRFDAQTNILGSICVLESCKDLCIGKVVYSSSVDVYGEPQYLPIDENHPIRPISPYAASKYAVENYLYCYKRNHGVDYVSLRCSNVYGPRQDSNGEAGFVAVFLDGFLRDRKPTINGDGGQTRDFIFVEDAAKAMVLALEKETNSKIFNIGSGVEVSIGGLYNEMKKIFERDLFPTYSDPIEGEVRRMSINPGLAEKELDWKPETTLEVGLRKTIECFKAKKN